MPAKKPPRTRKGYVMVEFNGEDRNHLNRLMADEKQRDGYEPAKAAVIRKLVYQECVRRNLLDES